MTNTLVSLSAKATNAGYRGVLLVVDELGKLFEYAARYPQKGDVFVLQEIAEQASRSGRCPILLVGILHQSFEDYAQHLDLATRREWAKIQGRFEDIAFLEPPEQVIRMIAKAIEWSPDATAQIPARFLDKIVLGALKAGIAPPGMKDSDFETASRGAYPIHPVTLVALPFLFRRFAQNERSLFSYLSSLEPYGFQEFIRTKPLEKDCPPVVRLSHLFDYFTKNFGAGLYRHPQALRWMEAADVLERREGLSSLHREVVKTIGVLNALGEFCHLNATEEVISLAVTDCSVPSSDLIDVLQFLREQSVLTFRKFNRTYRIWEGSDVDIDERIAEGERQIRHGLNLADRLRQYLPKRPLVARRHSFETGALRYFSVEYLDDPDAIEQCLSVPKDGGTVVVCLGESDMLTERFREIALVSKACRNTLFAIPQFIGELRAIVTEIGALRWAWENTPEIRDDRVARKELSLRIASVEQILWRNVDSLMDPRDEPIGSGCLWIHDGRCIPVSSPAGVSQLLSDVCDQVYPSAPRIRNELISRRLISSAAAAARRNLIERMLTRHSEEALGIEGYPPERSAYESVLRVSGLHRFDEGAWRFCDPDSSDPSNLSALWSFLSDAIFGSKSGPVPLDRLFAQIAEPPFGVLPGLHPVLLCAFLLAHSDETSLYREGTFLPEITVTAFEVLMRRPELFAVGGSRIAGSRALVVNRLARGLGVASATVPIVRALFAMVKSLPEYAWNTQRLSESVVALREAFRNAKSPEVFLYCMLPEALGMPAFPEGSHTPQEVDRFFDLLNQSLREWADATPRTIAGARDSLLNACGLSSGDSGWQQLRELAVAVEPYVTNHQTLSFVQRIAQSAADAAGVESVIALVASKPPRNWTDADAERFPDAAAAAGASFREAVCTRRISDDPNIELTEEQQGEAEALVVSVKQHLQKTTQKTSPAVIRAAMLKLLEELQT
ncbi:MAG TPA: hypothetical protein PKH07_03390 [bacterium]|nr:hypothetical protein [bacterium]